MITGIASDGVYDLLFQYLKLKLGFTTKDLVRIRPPLCDKASPQNCTSFCGSCIKDINLKGCRDVQDDRIC